jgi:hypothetical protein
MADLKLRYNDCEPCNDISKSDKPHTVANCCLICRNFEAVDFKANELSFQAVVGDEKAGLKDRQILGEQAEKLNALAKAAKAATAAKDSAYEEYLPFFNAYQAAYQAERDLRDAYDAAYTVYKKAFDESGADLKEKEAALKKAETAWLEGQKKLDSATATLGIYEEAFEKAKVAMFEAEKAVEAGTMQANIEVQSFARKLFKLAQIPDADLLLRARFLFVWIASSIKYDKDAKKLPIRSPSHTLVNGYEVCLGYARLFETMFNVGAPTDKHKCSTILGYAKDSAGRSAANDDPNNTNRHAWNVFPTKVVMGSPTYQVR